jgi:hypothetical protein
MSSQPTILLSATGFPLTDDDLLVKSNDLKMAFLTATSDPFAVKIVIQRLQKQLDANLAIIETELGTRTAASNNN